MSGPMIEPSSGKATPGCGKAPPRARSIPLARSTSTSGPSRTRAYHCRPRRHFPSGRSSERTPPAPDKKPAVHNAASDGAYPIRRIAGEKALLWSTPVSMRERTPRPVRPKSMTIQMIKLRLIAEISGVLFGLIMIVAAFLPRPKEGAGAMPLLLSTQQVPEWSGRWKQFQSTCSIHLGRIYQEDGDELCQTCYGIVSMIGSFVASLHRFSRRGRP